MTVTYNELLWIFAQLPGDYSVLDAEATGLPDENGLPDIVTLGITVYLAECRLDHSSRKTVSGTEVG